MFIKKIVERVEERNRDLFESHTFRAVGHRGAFLLFLALLDILYGWGIFSVGGATGLVTKVTLWLPTEFWGYVWFGIGFILLFGAFRRRDRIYFALATTIKCIWGVFWFSAWFFDNVPRGWVSMVVWLPFAGLG